jgi:NDP-sugar pyrophosphorylase family protein
MAERRPVDAIILAGGKGTRLQSVVSEVPKPLAPVNGRPFLDYQLSLLARSGLVERVVLAIGHLAERVVEHYRDALPPLPLEFVVEEDLLGTGGGLRNALPATRSERVLALNGDSVFAWDLELLLAAHERLRPSATMAVVRVPDTGRYGAVDVADGRVVAFREKEQAGGDGLINAGVYLFEREALEAIPPGRAMSVERDVFPQLAESGRLAAVAFESAFIDIGLPETYSAAGAILPELVGSG